MSKLRLEAVETDKPARIVLQLPPSVHRNLLLYAEAIAAATDHKPLEPGKIISAMIEQFMATDRGFAKYRREHLASSSKKVP